MDLYPWEKTEKFTTDAGVEVWVRSVPPYASMDVHAKLPPPPLPKVSLIGVDGHEEIKPALPESPEYEEYRVKRREHQTMIREALMNFELSYGVVQWKFPGSSQPENEPPKDWMPPSIMNRWGVKYDDLRVAFIKIAIIQTIGDQRKLEDVLFRGTPVTQEELLAALGPTGLPETDIQ